jgi:hypothetical protein
MKMHLLLCYAAFLLIACGQATESGKQTGGAIKKTEPIRLERTEGGYDATLLFQANSGLLSFGILPQKNASPALSMTRRVDLWRPLINQLLREQGRRKEYLVAVGEYTELAARIASAAVCSRKWNLKTGRPLTGDANQEVKNILKQTQTTRELVSFFSSLGFRMSVDNGENVLICPWTRIHAAQDPPCGRAPAPTSQVPCGASILFRITDAG